MSRILCIELAAQQGPEMEVSGPLLFGDAYVRQTLPGCDQDLAVAVAQISHFHWNSLLEIGSRKIDADRSGVALDSPHKILAVASVEIYRASLRRAAVLGCQSHRHRDPLAAENLNGAIFCPGYGIRACGKQFVADRKVEGYRGVDLRAIAFAPRRCQGRECLRVRGTLFQSSVS